MRLILLAFICYANINYSTSQTAYKLSGVILGENNIRLPGAVIALDNRRVLSVSCPEGEFSFSGLQEGHYFLEVYYMGYTTFSKNFEIKSENLFLTIQMRPDFKQLNEIIIAENYADLRRQYESRSLTIADQNFVLTNFSGSLMTTLSRIPGVSSMDIGSGQSKPVIRGMGFNRIVVSENGIKHEGQQWGADHGLEIDQFAVERIEVIKGPASLKHGSDAIGGVIELRQQKIPSENSFGGEVKLFGRTNNQSAGTSAQLYARSRRFYLSTRVTLIDFADYRIPADSVDIYTFRVPLYRNRLRNTAGNEANLHVSVHFTGNNFSSRAFVSKLTSKSGFFANAHGLEPRKVNTVLFDLSQRDILHPRQEMEHFKIISQNVYRKGKARTELDIAFQNNFREEWSPYVDHGFMPPVYPGNRHEPADLERKFNKNIYSANARFILNENQAYSFTGGINVAYHQNRIGGRGFLIPEFNQLNTGLFLFNRLNITPYFTVTAGIRYDWGFLSVSEYRDWFQSPVFNDADEITGLENLQRSPAIKRNFEQLNWAVGSIYTIGKMRFRANLGKGFRMPGAHEIAANGVNYHNFRFERGNLSLQPEISYQLDLGAEINSLGFTFQINPFVNYFPNFIYLNPTYNFDYLHGAGNQVFEYTQAEIIRWGGEAIMTYNISPVISTEFIVEYIYSEQLTGAKKGFTIPFSPPASALIGLKYSPADMLYFKNIYLSLDLRLTARQNRIVPPEKKTPGFNLVNLSLGTQLNWNALKANFHFQIQNLFNRKYFDHISFYRLIEVPGVGRNFAITLHIPFESNLNIR